jgi:hypothetical protein
LLAEVVSDRSVDPTMFESEIDLYGRFWDRKQKLVEARLSRSVAWTQIIDALCQYMSEREMLMAPEQVLDTYRADADGMVSEYVLVRVGDRHGFFHEGFFDYCFARRLWAVVSRCYLSSPPRSSIYFDALRSGRCYFTNVLAIGRDI